MKEHNCRGIVLAGRPYHVDPEVNHGIPRRSARSAWSCSPNSVSWLDPNDVPALTAYLAEDETDPAAHTSEGFRHVNDRKLTTMPLRVMNQWAYHARLYHCRAVRGLLARTRTRATPTRSAAAPSAP